MADQQQLYFAYGSNLDVEQMRKRCPSSVVLGRARLPEHRLFFAGHSERWKGAVATVTYAASKVVPGLLYRVTDLDLAALDHFEGYPRRYSRKAMSVESDRGEAVSALTYYLPSERCTAGMPSAAYRDVIETAYREWGFDIGTLPGTSEQAEYGPTPTLDAMRRGEVLELANAIALAEELRKARERAAAEEAALLEPHCTRRSTVRSTIRKRGSG